MEEQYGRGSPARVSPQAHHLYDAGLLLRPEALSGAPSGGYGASFPG
jgi:hypothetical protein